VRGPAACHARPAGKAGWATAQRPGLVADVARALRARRRGHRARDGAVVLSPAARFSVRAPPPCGGCAGQEEWRQGSPRKSGGGGVAGSGRRSGVLVEGSSGGVAASSGAILWLEAEMREGTVGAASEQRRKHGVGEKNPASGDGGTLLKGAAGMKRRGGLGEVERCVEGLKEGGPCLPPMGDSSGGARVCTVAGGVGSLASGARLAAGGCGGVRRGACMGWPGKEMEWAEPV
jgi:hypothetical protein